MSDEQSNKTEGQPQQSTADAWQEVGRQFQILGETLAAAFRTSWHDPEHRKRMQAVQGNLEAMVKEVDVAIQNAAQSPQAQQARTEAKRAAESLRTAGEQTVQEIRPQLLSALKQVNDELQKMVGRMEQGAPQQPASPPPPSGEATQSGSTEHKV